MNTPVYTTLISVAQLKQIIDEDYLRVFDCRFNLFDVEKGRQQFNQGHIPNSQYADLNRQLAGEVLDQTGRHPLPDKARFSGQLRQWGVDECSQVVVYDDAGGAIAARLWWMCKWAGISNVALLDGGIQAWESAGYEISTDAVSFEQTGFRPEFNDDLWVSTEEVENLANSSNVLITDARANSRFIGEHEPLDSMAGHLPGAQNFPFETNLNPDGKFKNNQQLAAQHQQAAEITQVISMCGSGVTACHNMLARAHAGLDMGRLYVGSWSEWITDSNRPVAKKGTDHK